MITVEILGHQISSSQHSEFHHPGAFTGISMWGMTVLSVREGNSIKEHGWLTLVRVVSVSGPHQLGCSPHLLGHCQEKQHIIVGTPLEWNMRQSRVEMNIILSRISLCLKSNNGWRSYTKFRLRITRGRKCPRTTGIAEVKTYKSPRGQGSSRS